MACFAVKARYSWATPTPRLVFLLSGWIYEYFMYSLVLYYSSDLIRPNDSKRKRCGSTSFSFSEWYVPQPASNDMMMRPEHVKFAFITNHHLSVAYQPKINGSCAGRSRHWNSYFELLYTHDLTFPRHTLKSKHTRRKGGHLTIPFFEFNL